ncbi:MAG: alpha-ketoacid dehydrogenase subunit beta [Acidimicrobiia bacterium]
MAELTIAQALNAGLASALEEWEQALLMGEDIGRTGGVFRITDGLRDRFGPERVIDTPVAESGIVGVGFGMAVAGMRPILEMQFMGFSYPAVDQIINHVSRIRHRSRHRFTAPLVIRIPYGGGIGAAEHHSESAEAIYAHTPGLKVVVPSRPHDAKGLLLAAVEDPDPVIFLEPIRLYRSVKEEVGEAPIRVAIGSAAVERQGSDVTLISYGAMMKESRLAAAAMAEEGIGVELIDLRTLVPLDVETIVRSVDKTGRAVVVTEAPRSAGFASEIVTVIQEHCLYALHAPIRRVTGWDTVFPLKRGESLYLPSVDRVVGAIRATLEA